MGNLPQKLWFLFLLAVISCSKESKQVTAAVEVTPSSNPSPLDPPSGQLKSFIPPIPPPAGYLNSTRIGDDGNATSLMGRVGISRAVKSLCIADDLSDEYARCKNFGDRSSCDRARGEAVDDLPSNRCEWLNGVCRPWTFGNCLRHLPAVSSPNFNKILLQSEYLALREQPVRLAAEFTYYGGIKILYFGHGPTARDLAQIALDAFHYANGARTIQVRTTGCSTFSDLKQAKLILQEVFSQAHYEAREQLRKENVTVEVTGNQLRASDENSRVADEHRIDNTQSEATLSARLYVNELNFVESGFYPCRSEKGSPLPSLSRLCFKEDVKEGITSKCFVSEVVHHEHCAPYTTIYGRKTVDAANYAVVPYTPIAYQIPRSPSPRLFPLTAQNVGQFRGDQLPFLQAAAYCEKFNSQLPRYWQLRQILEAKDLFIWFRQDSGINQGLIHGHVWSRDEGPGGAGSYYTYDVGSIYPRGASIPFAAIPATDPAFFICVPK